MSRCNLVALSCLAMCVMVSQATPVNPCPEGYDVTSTVLRSCYLISNLKLSWFDAETFCVSTGGHLMAITSLEEYGFIREIFNSNTNLVNDSVWTGGNDIGKQSKWMWAGINQAFENDIWNKAKNQPDGGKQRCVMMHKTEAYKLHDLECTAVHNLVCERNM